MKPLSLFGRKPSTAALAATVAVALVSGGALVSGAVGLGPNDDLRNVGQPGNDTVTPTPNTPSPAPDSPTPTAASSGPQAPTGPTAGSDQASTDTATESDEGVTDTDSQTEAQIGTQTDTGAGADTDTETAAVTDTTTTQNTAGEPGEAPDPVICHQHEGFMVGEEIQFDGRSFVSGEQSADDIVRWEWDFGTGTVGDTTYDVGNATGQEVTHTYENWGSYTVTLTVTTDDQVTENTSIDVYVGHPNDTYCPPDQRED